MFKFAYAALAGASLAFATAVSVAAQEQAVTAGGDVTADEASPLPPVVVQSAKEPIRRRARPAQQSQPSEIETPDAPPAAGSDDGAGSPAVAQDGLQPVGIFTLGQLDLIGGSTITNEAMWTFDKQSLDKAVNLLPGVSSTQSGGARNEREIFVRGFDRFRVPLSIDGVRITLPYDNRLDFARFLTPDLAEVQVQKGYVSVLNGPGRHGRRHQPRVAQADQGD